MKSFLTAVAIAFAVFCLIAGLQCSTLHAAEVGPVLAQGGLSELLQSPNVRTVAVVILSIIALGCVASYGWKPLMKLVDTAKSAKEKLANVGEAKTATVSGGISVDELVKVRAASIKDACPKSSAEFRLKQLDAGNDENKARVEYIAELEAKLEKSGASK